MKKMIDRCDICGGELLHNQTTDLNVWQDKELIVIRDIPADVCSQCGEAYFSAEISLKLDQFLQEHQRCRPVRYIPVPEYTADLVLA